jgi:SWI/SNF-related matrix-associated actin-dependent regulator of chromatin subfamily D
MDSSYRVKIEGRLLDEEDHADSDEEEDGDCGRANEESEAGVVPMDEDSKERRVARKARVERYKFSHFFKSMMVDFERNRMKDGAEQSVEWKKPAILPNDANPPSAADFDQLEFKRGGDENVNITINLVRDELQERFLLSPALAEIMDMNDATRGEVGTGIWEYIKAMGLQEDEEKRSFRCDELLKRVSRNCHYTERHNY